MSSAQTDAWVADFGIGIGAAAMLVGGYLFATGGAHEEEGLPTAAPPPPPQAGEWKFRMAGGAHGAEAILTRSF
jgi:hypothetical protein